MQVIRCFSRDSGRRLAGTGLFCLTVWACTLLATTKLSADPLPSSGQTSLGEQDRPIQEAHLVSPSHGWVLAGAHLLWTGDNGAQWVDITPPPSNKSIEGVFFLDINHAWTVLHQADQYAGPIYIGITTNGGNAWSLERLPIDQGVLEGYAYKAGISFTDEAHGWLLLTRSSSSAASRAFLFQTSDGGHDWMQLPDPPVNGSMRFLSPQTGWLCGGVQGDELYVTRNAGQTWSSRTFLTPPQAENSIHKTCFLPSFEDSQHGIVPIVYDVPQSGEPTSPLLQVTAIYTTSTGGDIWKLKAAEGPRAATAGSVTSFDSTVIHGFYAGNSIVIGTNFQRHAAPLPAGVPEQVYIRDLNFTDSQNGWMLGAYNESCMKPGCTSVTALFGTQDGGKTVNLLLQNTHVN